MTNKILIDEALRLADALERWAKTYATTDFDCEMGEQAAAELRRLHVENQTLRQALKQRAPAQVFGFEIVVDKTMPPDELRLVRSPPAPAPVPEAHKPMTDEQLHAVIRSGEYDSFEEFARAIEAAVLAKNGITSGKATEKGGA